MVVNAPNLRLTARDREIFWHVLRYGLATQEGVYRQFFDALANKPDAARSNLRRLCDGGYLTYFADPIPYYRLTPAALEVIEPLLGVPTGTYPYASTPLRTPQLIERLAIHAFCCLADLPRRALLQHEFRHAFPQLSHDRIPAWPYYLESTPQGSVLCLIVVDTGSQTGEQTRKIGRRLKHRMKVQAFRELANAGRFQVTILTTTGQRASEIAAVVTENQVQGVRIEPVPHLTRILLGVEPIP